MYLQITLRQPGVAIVVLTISAGLPDCKAERGEREHGFFAEPDGTDNAGAKQPGRISLSVSSKPQRREDWVRPRARRGRWTAADVSDCYPCKKVDVRSVREVKSAGGETQSSRRLGHASDVGERTSEAWRC